MVTRDGLCRRCYHTRWRRSKGGKPRQPRVTACSVEGCERGGQITKGLCSTHRSRVEKHGDPSIVMGTKRGSVRVDVVEFNGISFRRYPDSKHPTHRRYYSPPTNREKDGIQALHQEVWKSVHGPIPDGGVIHHIDGNHTNNDPSNLECVSYRGHYERHPEVIANARKSPKRAEALARYRKTPQGIAAMRRFTEAGLAARGISPKGASG